MWKTVTNEIIFRSVKESFCTELRHRRFSYKSVYLVYIPACKALLRHDFFVLRIKQSFGLIKCKCRVCTNGFYLGYYNWSFSGRYVFILQGRKLWTLFEFTYEKPPLSCCGKSSKWDFFMFSPNSVHCSIKSIRIVLISMYILV